MIVGACGGLCVMPGASTPSKWDHSLEPLFDELSKALVYRMVVEKGVDLHGQTCRKSLSIAYGVAVARESQIVATAVHADDHYGYPDCRPQFVKRFDAMERRAVEGFVDPNIHLHTPFVQKTRVEIVEIGTSLGVPYEDTWSCYGGGEIHWVLC